MWANIGFAALAVFFQFLPLTRELHYELAAAVALCISLGVGVCALFAWQSRGGPSRDAEPELMRSFGLALLSVTPALFISLVHNLVAGACGLGDGLLWYAVLVPPSAIVSVAIARLAWNLSARRWVRLLAFTALWSAPLLRGAWEALSGPHIFFYGWQIGFFPGGSWDPELPITPLLLHYRFSHLLIAAALVAVLLQIERARASAHATRLHVVQHAPSLQPAHVHGVVALAACLAAIVVAMYPLRSDIGLTRTDAWLQSELSDTIRTRYATIHFDGSRADSLDVWRARTYVDFYVARYVRALALDSSRFEPITFYAYASGADQKHLVGTSSASFTKPWRRLLHLGFDRIESTLEHELAHIVLEPFGNALGVSWSNGVLEGAAVALERFDDAELLHRHARAAYDFGLAPPVMSIMSSTGFASKRASLSYMLAGSFCRWLIDTYGIDRFKSVYATGSFEEHYGVTERELEKRYRQHLAAMPEVPAAFEPTVRYLYGGGSFFLQRCLRRLATLTGDGYRALAEERYDEALAHFRASLDEGISSGARAGIIRVLHGAGRWDELIDSMGVYAQDTSSHWLLPYDIELADALAMRSLQRAASSSSDSSRRALLLRRVVRFGGDEWTRTRAALRLILDPPGADARDSAALAMRRYFASPMTPIERVAFLVQVRAGLDRRAPNWKDRDELLRLMQAGVLVEAAPLLALGIGPIGYSESPLESPFIYEIRVPTEHDSTGRLYAFARASLLRGLIDARLYDATLDRSGTKMRHALDMARLLVHRDVTTPAPIRARDTELVATARPTSELVHFVEHLLNYSRTPVPDVPR